MSTPISSFTLAKQGSVREQADYVKLFRADNIGDPSHLVIGDEVSPNDYSERL